MTTTTHRPDFDVDVSTRNLGPNLPQKVGTRLWLPMLLMAVTAFAVGIVLAVVRADAIAGGEGATTIAALGHYVPAVMFIGFASVFAAISFAIARILGVLRSGGGQVQQAVGGPVQTLKMPRSAKAFIVTMAMGMMTIVAGVAGHFVVGAQVAAGSLDLVAAEQWAIWLEGIRRIGVAVYLAAIALGLATIVTVLRFQANRIRELES